LSLKENGNKKEKRWASTILKGKGRMRKRKKKEIRAVIERKKENRGERN